MIKVEIIRVWIYFGLNGGKVETIRIVVENCESCLFCMFICFCFEILVFYRKVVIWLRIIVKIYI